MRVIVLAVVAANSGSRWFMPSSVSYVAYGTRDSAATRRAPATTVPWE